jgi:hypothetical protein
MNFKQYWIQLSPKEKNDLADRANTPKDYLSQLAHGHRNAGANIIERLMKADSKITFQMMRD